VFQGLPCNLKHALLRRAGQEIHPGLPGDRLQLLDRGGPVDVAGNDQHFLLLALEQQRELADSGGLARALQAGHQDHRRWRDGEVEPRARLAHQAGEFAVHHADQRLAGREAADHFLAERLRAHRVDEVLHHRQRDVGLQQRDAHFAQRVLHVRLGEARFAADRLDDLREAGCEVVQHGGVKLTPCPTL
jgi:hypothetical protein